MAGTSIRKRLTARLLVGMVTLSVLANGLLYVYLRGELYEQYDDALVTEARAITGMLGSEDKRDDLPGLIERAFPLMHLGPEESGFLQVWDQSGNVVLRSLSLKSKDLESSPPTTPAGEPTVRNLTLPDGTDGRATALTFDAPTEKLGDQPAAPPSPRTYRLTLAQRRDELDDTLAHMAMALGLIGGSLTAAAVALLVWGVRRELKPLEAFSNEMAQVDAETLGYRFAETELADELVPIRRRLNDLLARLEESFNRERRFSANVAHELRTPIAELRSMIEVAIRWPPDATGVTRLHGEIFDVAERMSRLVEAMLSLIRVGNGQRSGMRETLSLAAMLNAAWTPHVALAEERSLQASFDIEPAITICGDRTIAEAMLGNILGNAAQHATAGSRIECSARSTEVGGPLLRIVNRTADLQPADVARLEEPFWRKDTVRTTGDRLGLGLSIVRDYARVLGVEVRFSMPEPSTLVAELRWPPCPAVSQ